MRGTGQESWAKFVVGNSKEVLARCKPLALDPLRGHSIHLKLLDERGARGTLKQLARLGETFVISDEGVALSVVRVFDDGRLVREISPGRESGALARKAGRLLGLARCRWAWYRRTRENPSGSPGSPPSSFPR